MPRDDGIGAAVRRKEDYRFITGRGNYTDDIDRPGQLHAVFLHSPHANARIRGIDAEAARKMPGVAAVFLGTDLAADSLGGITCGWQIHSRDGKPMAEPVHPVIEIGRASCRERVCQYV